MRLLMAEADAGLAESLSAKFQQERFTVQVIADIHQLSGNCESPAFDLLLLDSNAAAGGSVAAALRALRGHRQKLPIIVLSGNTSIEERVQALNEGADDVLIKPFAITELISRINAVLRRCGYGQELLVFEDLEVNRVSHEVKRAGHSIDLSPKEYSLLEYLLRNPGQPVSRGSIIEGVWRMNGDSLTNVVDVYINYLRRKIDTGSDRPLIRTIRGVGYQIGGNHVTG